MRILINDTTKIVPSSLSEITLKQRVEFQRQHGDLLDEMMKSILEIEDEDEKSVELAAFVFERAVRTVAFFLEVTPESLKESKFVDEVIRIYNSCLAQLFSDEEGLEPMQEFTWKGETWVLDPPQLKHGDRLTFGELIDSKQSIQNMVQLSKNRWECLIPLSAIFLRKPGEAYDESFLYEGSDRLRLMEDLPLDIALQVGFFLTSSLFLFITPSQFSLPRGLKELENMSKNISITSVG